MLKFEELTPGDKLAKAIFTRVNKKTHVKLKTIAVSNGIQLSTLVRAILLHYLEEAKR